MTYSSSDLGTGQAAYPTDDVPARTAWTGWISFAGVMMLMLGTFHAFQGFVAVLNDDFYLVHSSGLAIHIDYTTWGWLHIILGAVLALAGLSLLAGRMWARIVAVLAALVSALANIAFLGDYPVWSTIMVALDIIIIWAVMVHGREMKSAY